VVILPSWPAIVCVNKNVTLNIHCSGSRCPSLPWIRASATAPVPCPLCGPFRSWLVSFSPVPANGVVCIGIISFLLLNLGQIPVRWAAGLRSGPGRRLCCTRLL
jgi:hypothetical protein